MGVGLGGCICSRGSIAAIAASVASLASVSAAAPVTVVMRVFLHHRVMALHHSRSLVPVMLRIRGEGRLCPRHDEYGGTERHEQPEDDAKREVRTPNFECVRVRHDLRTS
jgi:hypothetical protein